MTPSLTVKAGVRLVRQAVARAGNNRGEQSGERTENRNGKDVALGHFRASLAAHAAGVAAQAGPIVGPAQAATRGFVFEIEIGHAREIDALERERSPDNAGRLSPGKCPPFLERSPLKSLPAISLS